MFEIISEKNHFSFELFHMKVGYKFFFCFERESYEKMKIVEALKDLI